MQSKLRPILLKLIFFLYIIYMSTELSEEEEVRILRELEIDFVNPATELLPISYTVAATFDEALQRVFETPSFLSDTPSLLVPELHPNLLSRYLLNADSSWGGELAQPVELTESTEPKRADTLIPVQFSESVFPEGQCAICFDGFQDSKVVYVPCQPSKMAHKDHVFHWQCLLQWVHSESSAGRSRTCPLCRARF